MQYALIKCKVKVILQIKTKAENALFTAYKHSPDLRKNNYTPYV